MKPWSREGTKGKRGEGEGEKGRGRERKRGESMKTLTHVMYLIFLAMKRHTDFDSTSTR